MAQHTFSMDLTWANGRNGTGHLQASQLTSDISIPQEMDGPGIGTNPDEMLLGAAATCYLITLAALLENAKVPVTDLRMQAEGFVDVTNGVFTYKKIVHKPHIFVEKLTEHEEKRIRKVSWKSRANLHD